MPFGVNCNAFGSLIVGESFQSLLTFFWINGAAAISSICWTLGIATPLVGSLSSNIGSVSAARTGAVSMNAPAVAMSPRRVNLVLHETLP